MLSNPIYIGQVRHKDVCYTGQHKGIVNLELWDAVQQKIADNRIGNKMHSRKTEPGRLAGKLFDASGERLVTVHANKKGRRYRYYVSQSLANGTKGTATSGWRLPGREIDGVVTQAILSIIHDRETIITVLKDAGIAAHEWSQILKSLSEADDKSITEKFLQRIELHPDGIRLAVSFADPSINIMRDIPMQMKRRGVEMRMIVGNTKPARIDQTLIRPVAKAHRWLNDLLSGKVATLAEIAKREGIDKSYVSRIINLAFFAPDIVENIVIGHQLAELTAQQLIRNLDLPMDWNEQRRILHIA